MSPKPRVNRVEFLVCGTQKAGTTALYEYFKRHPEIGLATKKEVHFFDNSSYFSFPLLSDQRYHRFFDFTEKKKIYGELTPSYMFSTEACQRIWEYNKDMKLIFLLRDPSERAYSQYKMEVSRDQEGLSFAEAIEQESSRSKEQLPKQDMQNSYVNRGFYAYQLKQFFRFFDPNQMLFLKYEDYANNQASYLQKIFHFLEVDTQPYDYSTISIHVSEDRSPCPPDERKKIIDEIYFDTKELEKMLDWDCSDWLN